MSLFKLFVGMGFMLVACVFPCVGQTRSVQQSATAPCSINIAGNQNSVTCRGLDRESAQRLLKVLNAVARNEDRLASIEHLLTTSPTVAAECHELPSKSPFGLECSVKNVSGREVRDVVFTFMGAAPLETVVQADPDLAIEQPQYVPSVPDPTEVIPELFQVMTAMYVKILRIEPKATARFQIATANPDNMRAAAQASRMGDVVARHFRAFHEALRRRIGEQADAWDSELALSAFRKRTNAFLPGIVSPGKVAVVWLTDSERDSLGTYNQLAKKYRDLSMATRPAVQMLAPVWRVKSLQSDTTVARMPPPVLRTYIQPAPIRVPPGPPGSTVVVHIPVAVPSSYEAGDIPIRD
jgi:hypothetical protein